MKSKLFVVMAVMTFMFCAVQGAFAQVGYMTSDTMFIRAGWVPTYIVASKDENRNDLESKGFLVQGEYNINLDSVFLGVGLEYERVKSEEDGADYSLINQFISPFVNVKFVTMGGLYVGAGLMGKYLISTEKFDAGSNTELEFDKKIDLWAQAILGYYMPVGEGVFIDFGAKFGYNLTRQQFSEGEYTGAYPGDLDQDIDYAYDINLYVGVGFRVMASSY